MKTSATASPGLQRVAYSVPEVAEMLGVHESTVKRHISAGLIPSFLLAGSRRIGADDLERYRSAQGGASK